MQSSLSAPALVVGFAIHGLAIARSLARRGVEVHCLSEASTPPPATTYTRYAKVHAREGLNSPKVAEILADFAETLGSEERIVLFPTSDRMAKHIALAWPELEKRYALSWAPYRELVLKLQRKDDLAAHCEQHALRHPRSFALKCPEQVPSAARDLRYPAVVKPVHPLSAFKAIRVESLSELQDCVEKYAAEAPFVLQEWIDGDEPSLYASAAYLDRGRVLGRFTSRKLDASPRGLGQGTVFEPIDSQAVDELSDRFFETLELSGPVAIEFKRDRAGTYWIIEANVGRTEYCVDLAIQCGFDLPYIEYLHATGKLEAVCIPPQQRECIWFDTDKDPQCFLRNLTRLHGKTRLVRRPVFPFFGHSDLRPFAVALGRDVRRVFAALGRRLSRQR